MGYVAPAKGNTLLNYCGSAPLSLIRSWVAPRKKQGHFLLEQMAYVREGAASSWCPSPR